MLYTVGDCISNSNIIGDSYDLAVDSFMSLLWLGSHLIRSPRYVYRVTYVKAQKVQVAQSDAP
jgi:hypothetical protein